MLTLRGCDGHFESGGLVCCQRSLHNQRRDLSSAEAGSCAITASQSGDDSFASAPDVTQTFNIAKTNTTVALSFSQSKEHFLWTPPGQTLILRCSETSLSTIIGSSHLVAYGPLIILGFPYRPCHSETTQPKSDFDQ